jgi:hypothetical protein
MARPSLTFADTNVRLDEKAWTVHRTDISLSLEEQGRGTVYRTKRGPGRPKLRDRDLQLIQAIEIERQKSPSMKLRAIIRKLVTNGGRFHGQSAKSLNTRYYEIKRVLK